VEFSDRIWLIFFADWKEYVRFTAQILSLFAALQRLQTLLNTQKFLQAEK
jgi:hypothetical protein